jgi:hypothetical protein
MQSCQAELLSEDTAWEVEAELAFHDDDPKAAIAALIEDRRRLHRKLALATRRAAQATPGDGARDMGDVRRLYWRGWARCLSRQASASSRRLICRL